MIEGVLMLLFWLGALYVVLWFFILLPADMARNRRRSVPGWIVVRLLVSPVLAILLLWCLGRRARDDDGGAGAA